MNEHEKKYKQQWDREEEKTGIVRPSPMMKKLSRFIKQSENDNEPEITPVRRGPSKEEKIVNFIQGIIKKPYLKDGRNSKLLRNNTHGLLIYKTTDEEEEEEKNIEKRYNRNTKNIEDSESENNEIEDEPWINLLRSNRSTVNPFRNSAENIIPKKEFEAHTMNEKEISLSFYEFAMKNHKKLFDNLRASYQQWKDGIDFFNTKDDKNPATAISQTYDKRLESLLWESLQLMRNQSYKDPIYDELEPNLEDVYYKPFDENDDQLRQFLLEEKDNESSDDDFDMDSDFGDWLTTPTSVKIQESFN